MSDTQDTQGTIVSSSLEGRVIRPQSAPELAEALEAALDYRGDVTLDLTTGESLLCYVFNRDLTGGRPSVDVMTPTQAAPRRIPFSDISVVRFTGQDTANGNSWEAWKSKKASQRQAEAARVEADARARGHL
ncbi:MAG: hypothetical protein U0172_07345 [Nitrospiraceae bacterium]